MHNAVFGHLLGISLWGGRENCGIAFYHICFDDYTSAIEDEWVRLVDGYSLGEVS